jgi:hypothetical protein
LGDPWTGRRGCARGLELELLCSGLADSPPIGRGQSAQSFLASGSSCSSRVLERLRFDSFDRLVLAGRGLSDRPRRGRGPFAQRSRTVRTARVARGPRTRYGPSAWLGARLVVLLRLMDHPPVGRGWSAPGSRTVRRGCCRTAKSFAS